MLLFYIPCPDKNTAQKIARTLLEEKLVGCANIVSGMESMYWWEGKIETSSEHILILKALKTSDAQERITKRVMQLHPYEVPCVMTLPVLGINDSYKKWLEESMK
ncbi:MAG: divalent cation tolerance protein [Bdellovibrio sp. ArHS]|uniref:divalent-cation tolerance protein CutA n=1 Tax=Bdellovibrio sp. ArHS TaxID=1569284 RepID=UPI000583EFB2|nr:divalent-cation tolerance protein CutA [Bdellovibrio sp. ArHS]KHD87090.1 MAG: divalent cation tolerance protein [Bdellovibrio sp. ArHS]